MPRLNRFQALVHLLSLYPLLRLAWDAWQGNLTANPIQAATQRSGQAAILWLLFSLACTPLSTLGFSPAAQVRRALGLYAFFYACLHFFIFAVLDYALDVRLLWLDLADKRYILVGLAGLLGLLPLALTSTRAWMKRLGPRWKKLHRLAYLCGLLAVIHYLWVVKSDIRQPLLYGAVLLVLLALRLPPLRVRLAALRPPWLQAFNRFLTRPAGKAS